MQSKIPFFNLPGYEGLYAINEYGEIFSFYRNRMLKPSPDKDGYLTVVLCKERKHKNVKIHRLVAIVFVLNPENKPQINHLGRQFGMGNKFG